MLTLTPKNLKAQVIAWDAERATMDFIQEHVQVECVIENLIPPCKLKVFLPDGTTTLLSYGDVIGRNEEGTLVIIPAADVEKYYDVNPVEILDTVDSMRSGEKKGFWLDLDVLDELALAEKPLTHEGLLSLLSTKGIFIGTVQPCTIPAKTTEQAPAPATEEVLTHTVTEEDLEINPELVDAGVQVGDEIDVPLNAIVDTTAETPADAIIKRGKKGKK